MTTAVVAARRSCEHTERDRGRLRGGRRAPPASALVRSERHRLGRAGCHLGPDFGHQRWLKVVRKKDRSVRNRLRAGHRARARRGRGTPVGGPAQIGANLDGLIHEKGRLLCSSKHVSCLCRVGTSHEPMRPPPVAIARPNFGRFGATPVRPQKAREISCFPPPSSIEASSPTVNGAVPHHSPPERAITHRHAPVIRIPECRKA